MKKFIASALVLSSFAMLAGCSHTSSYVVISPNGKHAISAQCDRLSECMKEVGNYCPYGYTPYSSENQNLNGFEGFVGNYTSIVEAHYQVFMLVSCKSRPVMTPDPS